MIRRLALIGALAIPAALAPAQAPKFVISTLAGAPLATKPVPALCVAIGSLGGIATDTGGNIYFTTALQPVGGNGDALLKLDQSGILTRLTGGQLNGVGGVVLDHSGNAYLTESDNRVRKVSIDGTISTFAGTGGFGSSGDGGPATSATLNPSGQLARDAAGNLYVSEQSRIRKISLDGIINTIAGDGTYGYAGDGGPATSAQLGQIAGMAVDPAGNLYVSDRFYVGDDCGCDDMLVYARLRVVSPDGAIRTVAGSDPGYSGDGGPATSAQFGGIGSLAADEAGNIYLADDSRIRKISTGGTITTVAGTGSGGYSGDGGPATGARVGYPFALAVDSSGDVYFADMPYIRKISAAGTISTVAGANNPAGGPAVGDGGPAYTAILSAPTGVAIDSSGAVYIADTFGNRIRKVTGDGIITTAAGSGLVGGVAGDGLQASQLNLNWPAGLSIDGGGNLYIADSGTGRVRKISPDGVIGTVAGSIQAVVPGSSGDGGPATAAQMWWPKDIALDSSGDLYIADTGNNRVRMVTPAGIITTFAGIGGPGYVGAYLGDGGPAVSAGLYFPSGLAVDGAGNLYVADTNNHRVRKISLAGIITTIAGNGIAGWSGDGGPAVQAQLTGPFGLKLDRAGNLYIADGTSVRIVSPAGIITTIAGTGVQGFSGDGGPATSALLGAWGLAFDGAGNLYVADPWSNSIRVLRPAGQ